MINANNNICVALQYCYRDLIEWETSRTFTPYEKRLLENLHLILQLCNPLGKYVTSKLEDFKKMEDPTYNNQTEFFDNEADYIEEFLEEVNSLPEYSYFPIPEKQFFQEPDNSYRRYELFKYYAEAYKIAKQLDMDLKRIRHVYHMAWRMCKKLDEYEEKYPFTGDHGLWEKDKRMNKIIEAVEEFRNGNKRNID
jgi:hypothetical protein